MKLIFLGPPGAGKGTIAKLICETYNIVQISTGDLFRAAVKNETELGLKIKDLMNSGSLIPDEVTIGLVKERLAEDDLKNGYILDGFPRTIPQAEALSQFADIDAAINFTISDDDILIQRLSGRRVCKECGAIFHMKNNPPHTEGICDKCDGDLYTRKDDEISSIKHRLVVYQEQTAPLIGFYQKAGLLKNIDASTNPKTSKEQLQVVLKEYETVSCSS